MADIIEMPAPRKQGERNVADLPVTAVLTDAAVRCQRHHLMGLIVGPAGIGKSTAWEALARGDGPPCGDVVLVTANRTTTTATKILALIQAGFDAQRGFLISGPSYQSPADRFESVVNDLRRLQPLKPEQMGPLLIVDEAQHLTVDSLDTLRSLWDVRMGPHREGSCGLILSGNPTLAANLRGKASQAHFAQLTSRIGLTRILKGPGRSDVLALCTHRGIGDAACRDYLCEIAAKPGALRLVDNVVKNARIESGGGRLTLPQLRDAAASMGI